MRKSIVILFVVLLCTSQAFACGSRNSSNEEAYTAFLLSSFFSTKMSRDEACVVAKSMAKKTNQELQLLSPGVSVYNDTQKIYNHLFTGSYMRNLSSLIARHLAMKGTPAKQAKDKAKLLYKIIKSHTKRNKDKWLFQTTVLVPYAYNVHRARDWANTTERFSKKGRKMRGCGRMVCN